MENIILNKSQKIRERLLFSFLINETLYLLFFYILSAIVIATPRAASSESITNSYMPSRMEIFFTMYFLYRLGIAPIIEFIFNFFEANAGRVMTGIRLAKVNNSSKHSIRLEAATRPLISFSIPIFLIANLFILTMNCGELIKISSLSAFSIAAFWLACRGIKKIRFFSKHEFRIIDILSNTKMLASDGPPTILEKIGKRRFFVLLLTTHALAFAAWDACLQQISPDPFSPQATMTSRP